MKRGLIPLLLIVLFGVIGGVTFAWYASLKAGNFGNVKMIGADQLTVLGTYKTAESDLMYLDLSTQYLAARAIAETMGGEMVTDCGSYGGYPLYSDAQQLCVPPIEALAGDVSDQLNPLIELQLQNTKSSSKPHYEFSLRRDGDRLLLIGLPSKALEYKLPFGAEAK